VTASVGTEQMNQTQNRIELAAISAFFLLLSLFGIAWSFSSGLIAGGIDGIMLVIICLTMAAVFALQLLLIVRPQVFSKPAAVAPAKPAAAAAKPAAAPAPAPKPATPETSSQAK